MTVYESFDLVSQPVAHDLCVIVDAIDLIR
jgi:hypothetical protein